MELPIGCVVLLLLRSRRYQMLPSWHCNGSLLNNLLFQITFTFQEIFENERERSANDPLSIAYIHI